MAKERSYSLILSNAEIASLIPAIEDRIEKLESLARSPESDAVLIVKSASYAQRLKEVRDRAMKVWCQ